jgi:hypothetical protein
MRQPIRGVTSLTSKRAVVETVISASILQVAGGCVSRAAFASAAMSGGLRGLVNRID